MNRTFMTDLWREHRTRFADLLRSRRVAPAGLQAPPRAADAPRHIDAFRATIRWVLPRDPAGDFEPQALLCTDPTCDPRNIIG